MNSLFAKILLWFWCTIAVYVVGSAFISALNVGRYASSDEAPVARLVNFQLEEARTAYETGGRPALQAFMDTLQKVYRAKAILTDEHGKDLLTNRVRSDLVSRAMRHPKLPTIQMDNDTVARVDADGRYWFFYEVPPHRVGIWFLSPDHLFFMLAGVLL
jgi:two-component system sensor histidine kinase CpxA